MLTKDEQKLIAERNQHVKALLKLAKAGIKKEHFPAKGLNERQLQQVIDDFLADDPKVCELFNQAQECERKYIESRNARKDNASIKLYFYEEQQCQQEEI